MNLFSTKPSQGISAISRHYYYPHAYCPLFCGLFYYQVPRESSSTRFVVKSSLTGLTLFKHTQLPDLSSEAVTMAKRMQDKESIAGMSWLVLL
ncbi:hypothetical protein ACFCX9_29150, partial [Klebsiella michiganensis]